MVKCCPMPDTVAAFNRYILRGYTMKTSSEFLDAVMVFCGYLMICAFSLSLGWHNAGTPTGRGNKNDYAISC